MHYPRPFYIFTLLIGTLTFLIWKQVCLEVTLYKYLIIWKLL